MSQAHRVWVMALGLLWAACGNAEQEKAKIAEIQRQADERVAKAEHDTKEKIEAANKQIEELKSELANAATQKAQADDAASKAQASAEEHEKAAHSALTKARQAYKEEGRVRLATLNKDLSEVSGKVAKAPANVKPVVEKSMQQIATHQKAIAKDIGAFDSAALDQLKAAKATLDKDLAALKSEVRTVRAKLQ